jgi:hypothetical protein
MRVGNEEAMNNDTRDRTIMLEVEVKHLRAMADGLDLKVNALNMKLDAILTTMNRMEGAGWLAKTSTAIAGGVIGAATASVGLLKYLGLMSSSTP